MAILGRWTGSGAYFPTTSWAAPNGLFATQARNDSSAYSMTASTSTLTLPSSGLADGYLVIARLHSSTTHNNRHTQQDRFVQTGGTGNFANFQTGSYSRNNSNNENYDLCAAFIDNPSASATIQYQWRRSDGDGTPAGSVNNASLDVIPLYYSDIGMYTDTSNALMGGTTPNTVALGTTTLEGTSITRSSNTITVTGDNKRYLIIGSYYAEGRGGRTQRWIGGSYDSTLDRGAMSYAYWRDGGTDDIGCLFFDLLETVTASRTIELVCWSGDGVSNNQGGAESNGSTPSSTLTNLVVLELNDDAEVVRSSNASATAQNIDSATPVDLNAVNVVDFNDSASYTKADANGINVETGHDAFIFANVGGASRTVSSSARYTGQTNITVDGVEDTNVEHGNYMRGDQSSTGTFGYASNPAGFKSVASNVDIGVSAQQNGDAGDCTVQSGWVGLGAINLDTLEAATATDVDAAVDTLTVTGLAATVLVPTAINAALDTLTITAYAATVEIDIDYIDTQAKRMAASGVARPWMRAHLPGTLGTAVSRAAIGLTYGEHLGGAVAVDASAGALSVASLTATVLVSADIPVAVDTVEIAGQAATVLVSTDISSGTGALSVASYTATVLADVDIAASVDALEVVGYAAEVLAETAIFASVDAIEVVGYTATVVTDSSVTASVGALTIAGYSATVLAGEAIPATLDTIEIAGYAAEVLVTTDVSVSAGALTVDAYDATVLAETDVSASLETLVVSGQAAIVLAETDVLATQDTLEVASYAATIRTDISLTASAGALSIVGYSATVSAGDTISATVGALEIAGYPATVLAGISINATADTLDVAGYAAEVAINVEVSVAQGSLVVAAFPATVAADTLVSVTSDSLSIASYPASIDVGFAINATSGALSVAGYAAQVSTGTNVESTAGALEIDSYAASVEVDTTVAASSGALTVTGYAATVSIDVAVSVSLESVSIAGYAANVIAGAARRVMVIS